MSFTLREILHDIAATVGREYLHEHIDALAVSDADERGETEAEKVTASTPLTDAEQLALKQLQARLQAPKDGQEVTADATQ